MPPTTEFDIPFTPRISSFLPWVRPRALAWARDHDLIRSAAAEHRFVSWELAYAAARIYPNAATANDLLKIMNFFALRFLFDDFLFDDQADHRSPDSVDRYLQVVHEMIAILLRPPGTPLELTCPATRALQELWIRMTEEMSPQWCDRFAFDYGRFQAAVAYEAQLSARGEIPDVGTYVALRRTTVGLFYSLDQTEWAGRYELPARVLIHPLFVGLREATTDVVAWMNDIHSHDRESARQDEHNLLTVLAHHGMTPSRALAKATDMTYTALRRFLRLRGGVAAMVDALRLDDGERHAVEESVLGMENWIRGNHDWSRTTGRYAEDTLSPYATITQ